MIKDGREHVILYSATDKFCYKCGMALDLKTAMKVEEKSKMIPEIFAAMQNDPEFQKIFAEAVTKATNNV